MRLPADEVVRLYDAHAPLLYAVALRILDGNAAAAGAALVEVFTDPPSGELPALVRATRDRALTRREDQTATTAVVQAEPSPLLLVDEAFYRGASAAELAKKYGIPETTVRTLLRDGLRSKVRK
jgi:DNA-directed RNA polymerase specialized sigma24 family protein